MKAMAKVVLILVLMESLFCCIESPAFASQPHPALCELASTPCATVAMQVLRILNFKISLF